METKQNHQASIQTKNAEKDPVAKKGNIEPKFGSDVLSNASEPFSAMKLSDFYCAAPGDDAVPDVTAEEKDKFPAEAGKPRKSIKAASVLQRLQRRVSITLARPSPKIDGKRRSIFSVDRENPDSEQERRFEKEEMKTRFSGEAWNGLVLM